MPFFKIKNLSPALDGLIVKGELMYPAETTEHQLCEVVQIVNPNVFVGDRDVKWPVDSGCMYISKDCLEAIPDVERREYDAKHHFGKCLFEGHYVREDVEVAYARYENTVQVTVTEKQKMAGGKTRNRTLFAGYFHNGPDASTETQFEGVKKIIEGHLGPDGDVDDLVFALKRYEES